MAVINITRLRERLTKLLTPWFMGREQNALIEAMRESANETLIAIEPDIDALQDQLTELYSPNGADLIGILDLGNFYSGTSVEDALQQIGPTLAGGPYQPLDADLTAVSALATTGVVRRTAVNAWSAGGTLTVTEGGTGTTTSTGTGSVVLSNSPAFSGNPTAPTAATADNTTSIATTAFVKAQGYAPIASPTFTGDPKAPTPATADNDTSIATTAFVKAQGYTGNTGTVTSVAVANATGITWTGSPITTSGTLTPTLSSNLQSWSGIAPATKADDSAVMHLAGSEVATGYKRFSASAGASSLAVGANAASGPIVTLDIQPVSTGARFLVRDNGSNTITMDVVTFNNTAYASWNSVASSYSWLAFGGTFTFGGGGLALFSGPVQTAGSNNGLFFDNRSGTARTYAWYATGNTVRLSVSGLGDKFTFDEGGNLTATNFVATSDRSLKTNIEYVTPRDLSSLRLARWNWKSDNSAGMGVIAQEVALLAQDYVYGDAKKGVDKAGLALEAGIYAAQEIKKLKLQVAELQHLARTLGLRE